MTRSSAWAAAASQPSLARHREVLDFFAVHRLGEVFNRMDELGAEYWRARFEATIGASVNYRLPPNRAATSIAPTCRAIAIRRW